MAFKYILRSWFIALALMMGALIAPASGQAAARPFTCDTTLTKKVFSIQAATPKRAIIATANWQCSIPDIIFQAGSGEITTFSGARLAGSKHCLTFSFLPCRVTSRYIRGVGVGRKRVHYFNAHFTASLKPPSFWIAAHVPGANQNWNIASCHGYGTPRIHCDFRYVFAL